VLAQRRTPTFANGLPQTQAAVSYARAAHEGQLRKVDGAPFITHPLEVASLLYHAGAPDHVIAAGVLHDVIEKTAADAAEIRRRFGARISRLVAAVSEDESIRGYARRKAALRESAASAGDEALMVLAADKVSKARELRLYGPVTPHSRERRIMHYRHCLRLLERRLPGSPLVGELDVELRHLHDHAAAPAMAGAG
jgi:(p)ppGpp synthase/HD superfamily hydrolase